MNISLKPTCQIPLGYFLLHYKLSLQAFEGSVQTTDLCKQYAIVTEFISNQQPLYVTTIILIGPQLFWSMRSVLWVRWQGLA